MASALLAALALSLVTIAGLAPTAGASRGYYVGKNLTADGSVLLGGFGHEPSSHWIEIVPRRQFPEGATTTVGVTDRADRPGVLTEIPQVRETYKYITSNYSEYAGFPAPLTNGGLNENGVAARDISSRNQERLLELTPLPQRGPNYSDLARIAMERARTAREAVEIVGDLIDKYGYSDYYGNSHMFADKDEGWVFMNYGGGQGLWAAERLGPNEIRVSGGGYINPLPLDYKDHPDEWLASDNLIEFAVERGWFDPSANDEFDAQAIYGTIDPEVSKVRERELQTLVPVSLEDMLAWVRDPRWSNDRAGYGQVTELKPQRHPELQTLWTAVTSAVTTPYVPLFIGAQDVPPEYKQHRYMTSQSDDSTLARDYAALEATEYATRTFKRILYYTCEHPDVFLKPVTAEIEAFETDMLKEKSSIDKSARNLLDAGKVTDAERLLTDYDQRRLLDGLGLGDALVEELDKRTREKFGIRMPTGRNLPGETLRPESQQMAIGAGLAGPANSDVTCDAGVDTYPRLHGSYKELVGQLIPKAHDKHDEGRSFKLSLGGVNGGLQFLLGGAFAVSLLVLRRRRHHL